MGTPGKKRSTFNLLQDFMKTPLLRLVSSCALCAAAFTVTAHAAGAKDRHTFVLVHGATAGGWEWKGTGNFLLADGHTVYRATLTGLGERMHLNSPAIDLQTHIFGGHVAQQEDPRGVATLIAESVNDRNQPVQKDDAGTGSITAGPVEPNLHPCNSVVDGVGVADSANGLDLAGFKRAWQGITEEYTSPRNEPKDSVFRERVHAMEERAGNLLVARFTNVVERREIDEAIEIFTHFGASEIQARLVAVPGTVDDRKFVARIVHAELSPSKWSDEAKRNHADGFSPDSAGPIRRLYFDLLGESADVPIVFPGGIMDETYRPFREKLEGKYPSLLERNAGSRF